jgi:hypothetical protein
VTLSATEFLRDFGDLSEISWIPATSLLSRGLQDILMLLFPRAFLYEHTRMVELARFLRSAARTLPLRKPRLSTTRNYFAVQNRAQPKVGNPNMFKHPIALVAVMLAAAWVAPASAQTPGTSVGTLSCRMGPSIGLIFGSQQRMACRFQPNGPYPPEAYVGVMNTVGLDIGITAGGALAWGVFAPTAGPMYGGLAGTYAGASGAIGVGVGVGANLLFGGTGRSIALQPLSVEGSVGVNLSLGVSALTLALAR